MSTNRLCRRDDREWPVEGLNAHSPLFGVSDMWVWRHMRDHGFPKPVQFGGPTSARHWKLSDIETWER
jgi:predicted DNA-binding transcriptional regulator AlpA